MSKFRAYRTVARVVDGKNMITIESFTCPGDGAGGHIYQHINKTGKRAGLPKLNERCICGSDYWGEEDDAIYFEALANGRVNTGNG